MTARPTASRKNTMTSTSRGRQGQKPHGKNPRPEFKETVRYCEVCRSTIMQESASGAMSSMCEDCSWTQRMDLVFSSVLHAFYHPPLPPPPPGLEDTWLQQYATHFLWHSAFGDEEDSDLWCDSEMRFLAGRHSKCKLPTCWWFGGGCSGLAETCSAG